VSALPLPPRIHPTAVVEEGVVLGEGTAVWDGVHIRRNTKIGRSCIVGEKTYIAYDVTIGDLVKINAHVYICTGVTVQRGVMIAAGVIFTNDRFPRATDPELTALRPSEPGPETERTLVREGATLGSGARIGPGITIGRWAMVGMGAVVTRDVPDFALVLGNPARPAGWVCRCGRKLPSGPAPLCPACRRAYRLEEGEVLREA